MKKNANIRPFGLRLVWCEVASASFLIGSYFSSLGVGVLLFCLFGLILHYLLSQFKSDKLISAHVTILWTISAILWGSWLESLAATTYITIILTLLVLCISYLANLHVLQWPQFDRWFHSSSTRD